MSAEADEPIEPDEPHQPGSEPVEAAEPASEPPPEAVDRPADPAPPPGQGGRPERASTDVSVEDLLDDLDRVTAERDSYLEDSRRLAAEFSNFRRQAEKRASDVIGQANAGLVERLLPTLDACEAAIAHGADDVEPVFNTLLATLEKEGLERIRPEDEAFDPERHEAVMHEEGGDGGEAVVAEILRTGYAWKGRVLRPALVKVRG